MRGAWHCRGCGRYLGIGFPGYCSSRCMNEASGRRRTAAAERSRQRPRNTVTLTLHKEAS